MTNVARLPGPIADVWDWQRMGLCRGRDSAQFFHPDGERGASRGRREAAAKALCQSCPVRAECAAHALAAREPYGVWGGFTEAERLRLLASNWEEAADRRGGRIDVARLEARLGIRPAAPQPLVSTATSPAGRPASTAPTGRPVSTAPNGRPASTAPNGRPASTAPNGRPASTAPAGRPASTAPAGRPAGASPAAKANGGRVPGAHNTAARASSGAAPRRGTGGGQIAAR